MPCTFPLQIILDAIEDGLIKREKINMAANTKQMDPIVRELNGVVVFTD